MDKEEEKLFLLQEVLRRYEEEAATLLQGKLEVQEILTNKEVIAVNQDPKGEQARRFMDMGEKEIWAKPLANGELAVCFMNRTEFPWKLDYDWRKQTIYFATDVSIRRFEYKVRDLWQHKDLGTTKSNLVAEIPPHGVLMVRLSKVK